MKVTHTRRPILGCYVKGLCLVRRQWTAVLEKERNGLCSHELSDRGVEVYEKK